MIIKELSVFAPGTSNGNDKAMKQIILAVSVLCVVICGCRREPVIEDQPVKNMAISQPGEVDEPAKQAAAKKESKLGPDNVYKVDAKRYYNAVIPVGAVEIAVGEADTRFYVPDMRASDVISFLEKYFPYQNLKKGENRYLVDAALLEQYMDDSIIPQLDPNIIKPSVESAVGITVFWNQGKHYYEWIYTDPMERVRAAERDAVVRERIQKRDVNLIPEQKVVPSNDSPGNMVNAKMAEIH